MEIIKLESDVTASEDTDCIKINKTADGRYSLVASAFIRCGNGDELESVALVASETYPSYDAAEAAGLAWGPNPLCFNLHRNRRRRGTGPAH